MVDYFHRDTLLRGVRVRIVNHPQYKGYLAVIMSTDRSKEVACVAVEAKGIHTNVLIPMRFLCQIIW